VEIVLSADAERTIKAAALEVHPDESLGVLLGSGGKNVMLVTAAYVYQRCKRRSTWVEVGEEEEERIEDFFGEEIIGDVHTHPDDLPSISSNDRMGVIGSGDGFVSMIVSVWPTKRFPHWCFRFRAYFNDDGKVRRAKIVRR